MGSHQDRAWYPEAPALVDLWADDVHNVGIVCISALNPLGFGESLKTSHLVVLALLYALCFLVARRLILRFTHGWLKRVVVIFVGMCSLMLSTPDLNDSHKMFIGVLTV